MTVYSVYSHLVVTFVLLVLCSSQLNYSQQFISKLILLTMDLSRAPNDRKLYLCKWYFRAGFIFLPFVWAINTIWFFNEAFRKPAFEEQNAIRKYVIYSGIGSIAWVTAIIAWVLAFQLNRAEWGEFADSISFIIPLGRA